MSVKYFDKSTNQWKIFPGTTGLPGKDGKDCFDVARENGYTGTKEDYYKLLKDIVDINDQVIENTNNIKLVEDKIPDVSNLATKAEIKDFATIEGVNVTATNLDTKIEATNSNVTALSGNIQDLQDIVDNKADQIDLVNYAKKSDLNAVKTTADNAANSVNDLSDVVAEQINDLSTQISNKIDGTEILETKKDGDNVITNIAIDASKKLKITYGAIKTTGISEMYSSEDASVTDNTIILKGNRVLYNATATNLKIGQIDISEGYDGVVVSDVKITWQKSDNFNIYLSPDINNLETGNKYIYSFQIVDSGTTDIYINGSSYVVCA